MSDDVDRASAWEQQLREFALNDQAQRAGLAGMTVANSAEFCEARGCGVVIPAARRAAVPGCRLCVVCRGRAELKGRA